MKSGGAGAEWLLMVGFFLGACALLTILGLMLDHLIFGSGGAFEKP